MEWQEITVKTSEELVEAITAIFYDLSAGGVVIEDPRTYNEYIESGEWDYYSIPQEVLERSYVVVKGYLPVNEDLLLKEEEFRNRVAKLGSDFPCSLLEVSYLKLQETDWANSWKAYYKPHHVGKVVIKPTWEVYQPSAGEIIVELDPGMAFGTGTHPTTTMVLEFIQELVKPHTKMLDVGTGSGVLAIAAAKLGASGVAAFDLDPVAVKVADTNISHNHVQERVSVERRDLLQGYTGKANLITANIIADVVIRLFAGIENLLEPDGDLIASGIIIDRLEDVLQAAEKYHLNLVTKKTQGEWVALHFKR